MLYFASISSWVNPWNQLGIIGIDNHLKITKFNIIVEKGRCTLDVLNAVDDGSVKCSADLGRK